jgi:DNA-binding Xre family transcriptional regulator
MYCPSRQKHMAEQQIAARPSELDELNRIRLDEGLTYNELEEQVGVSAATLNRLLTTEGAVPYDRTLHRIRQFLTDRKVSRRARA